MGWLQKGFDVATGDVMKDGGTLYKELPQDGRVYMYNPENKTYTPLTEREHVVDDVPPCDDGYDRLRSVFDAALSQSRDGKGRERHAEDGTPFDEQIMVTINRKHRGFCLGQAAKKIDESERLPPPHKIHELLGALVYIAGEIITIQDEES